MSILVDNMIYLVSLVKQCYFSLFRILSSSNLSRDLQPSGPGLPEFPLLSERHLATSMRGTPQQQLFHHYCDYAIIALIY